MGAGVSPCPFPAGVQHIWPPGRYGWVAAIKAEDMSTISIPSVMLSSSLKNGLVMVGKRTVSQIKAS